MNIGFDVDGVLFNIENYQLVKGKEYFKNKEIKDINGYGIKEVFDTTTKEEIMFWLRHTIDFNKNIVAIPGMSDLINSLRNSGNKVYIITSRAMADKPGVLGSFMRKELEESLKRNGIFVDGIIYTDTKNMAISKLDAIKKYNIHIMVDDNKEILDTIKNDTKAICFSTRNNSDYNDKLVSRVNNATELSNEIQRIIFLNDLFSTKMVDYHKLESMSDIEKSVYFTKLKESYKSMIDKYSLEKGENGCEYVIGKMQKIYNFLYKPHVIHPENMPTRGKVILVSNHLHSFDPLLLMTKSKMPFHLLAKEELHDSKIWDKLFTTIGSVFVDNNDAKSRKKAKEDLIKVVLNGGVAMMYPEGTRNKTDQRLLDFHIGTVSIAQITGAPIIPFAINQDYKIINNKLCVAIGDPIYVSSLDNLVDKNNELKLAISNLLEEVENYEQKQTIKLTKK